MDEEVEGLNCMQLKLENKCDPNHHMDAMSCQKTCDLCYTEKAYSTKLSPLHKVNVFYSWKSLIN